MSVGVDTKHDSAVAHVTGESIFIDDRPALRGELFVGIVGAPIASGTLLGVDTNQALKHPDCVAVYTAKDLAHKKWGPVMHDQPILVEKEIGHMGEPVALIASKRRESVEAIIKLVKVKTKSTPAIFTIQEAKQKGSILYKAQTPFVQGNFDKAFQNAPLKIRGTFSCGGQEHFYMESQAAVAYPLENGQIEVHSSSQHPSETQRVVAEALGLRLNQVVCIVKRMGGGFGGKESQAAPIAAYAGLVAAKQNRAARCILTKDQDMKMTGKRHPFENEYEVGFDHDGKILALKVMLQSDGGAYLDLSASILERAMFHMDGIYYLENVHIDGVCYKTNNHSNTAFRGFGGPQGTMTMECIMEEIAQVLKKDAAQIRKVNLYQNDKVRTPYGQLVENNMLPAIYQQLIKSSDYKKRLKEITQFNKKRTGIVRGISITGTKFGIAFTARFLNQGNALVNLHLDGTVQVSTGATEMGQGVNTKIQQVVAYDLGLNLNQVQVMPTSTEKNHNTSPTAASSGADINCAAALEASQKIKARLTALAKEIFAGKNPSALEEFQVGEGMLDEKIVFKDGKITDVKTKKSLALLDVIKTAYFNRISMGAYAFFKTKNLGFDKATVQGRAFNYYTQGMAVSEVSIDEYTGEVKVLRSDILMDLGRPLNPGIDRGQVIGAFVQAQGWVTTENLYYDKERHLVSHSPTTYKIPNVQDIPRILKVDFIENNDVKNNVFGSKAVGEPPFLLGSSVWTAVKHALSFRAGEKLVEITSPATSEVVLRELIKLKS
ncbi:MAG: molybdopterin-dependent oxidoreductase [Bacteriovoracaceae bacterium]|nr:molybdopterin-dependent oxidoreductase [Bacteriovoracaceae bacterium]